MREQTNLVSLECVLPGERLATAAIAQEWLLACVCIPMPLQIVLTIEREWAHVAGKRARWRGRILRACDVLRKSHLVRVLRDCSVLREWRRPRGRRRRWRIGMCQGERTSVRLAVRVLTSGILLSRHTLRVVGDVTRMRLQRGVHRPVRPRDLRVVLSVGQRVYALVGQRIRRRAGGVVVCRMTVAVVDARRRAVGLRDRILGGRRIAIGVLSSGIPLHRRTQAIRTGVVVSALIRHEGSDVAEWSMPFSPLICTSVRRWSSSNAEAVEFTASGTVSLPQSYGISSPSAC